MLVKYGTYRVFKNKDTEEVLRVAPGEELEKLAEDKSLWVELTEDPDDSQ